MAVCLESGALRTYLSPGSCDIENGGCSYNHEDTACEYGCFDGTRCRKPGDAIFTTDRYGSPHLLAESEGGTLFLSGMAGSLAADEIYATDLAGKQKWHITLDEDVKAMACGKDGTLYFASVISQVATVRAVNEQGTTRWSWSAPSSPQRVDEAHLAIDDARSAVYLTIGAFLYAVSVDGALRWSFDTRDIAPQDENVGPASRPMVNEQGEVILFGRWGPWASLQPLESLYGTLIKVDAQGKLRWRSDTIFTTPRLFGLGPEGALYVWDIESLGIQALRDEGHSVREEWVFSKTPDGAQINRSTRLAVTSAGELWFATSTTNSLELDQLVRLNHRGEINKTLALPFSLTSNLDERLGGAPWIMLGNDQTLVVVGLRSPHKRQLNVASFTESGETQYYVDLYGNFSPFPFGTLAPLLSRRGVLYVSDAGLGFLTAVQSTASLRLAPWAVEAANGRRTSKVGLAETPASQ